MKAKTGTQNNDRTSLEDAFKVSEIGSSTHLSFLFSFSKNGFFSSEGKWGKLYYAKCFFKSAIKKNKLRKNCWHSLFLYFRLLKIEDYIFVICFLVCLFGISLSLLFASVKFLYKSLFFSVSLALTCQ